MADVNSKNMYALLGNTSDQDSDREPEAPTRAIDGPAARQGKRNAPKEAPAAPAADGQRGGRGGRRGNFTGSEQAYRDKEAGRTTNRGKQIDDGVREDRHSNQIRGGRIQNRGEGRGGRGGAGGRGARGAKDDRHSRTGQTEHVKQGDAAWGGPTGEAELADEQAGAAIAQAEEKAAVAEGEWNASAAAGAPGWDDKAPNADSAEVTKENEDVEPEENHISYADYLASKTRDMSLGVLEARKPNEGPTKTDKKFANAKELPRADDEDYIPASEAKAARQRERKAKSLLDIDYAFKEQPREGGARGGGRGGRGGDRGDRPRGPPRGSFRGGEGGEGRGEPRERGSGEGRGRGDRRGRGEGRGGGRGFEGRGGPRGGRGGPRGDHAGAGGPSVNDETAFPSLGGK